MRSRGAAPSSLRVDNGMVLVVYDNTAATTLPLSIGGKLFPFQMPGTGWATVDVTP